MPRRRTLGFVLVALVAAWWMWPDSAAPTVIAPPQPARARLPQATPAPPPLPVRSPAPQTTPDEARDTGPPPDPPPVRVVCTIDPSVSAVTATGTARLERFGGPAFTEVHLQGTTLVFDAPADTLGVGTILLPGFSAAEVFYADGPCVLDALEARAAVYGMVTASEGIDDDRVEVRGCGAYVRTDVDGGFFAEIDAKPCTLRATRRDGMFTMRSDPLYLEPRPGEDIQVELVFPPYRAAGVGTSLSQWRSGIFIREVFEDTPADFAGLEPGDRIIALDGEPIDDLDVYSFVDIALGPAGSAVSYTVERGGEVVDVEMVRELID